MILFAFPMVELLIRFIAWSFFPFLCRLRLRNKADDQREKGTVAETDRKKKEEERLAAKGNRNEGSEGRSKKRLVMDMEKDGGMVST